MNRIATEHRYAGRDGRARPDLCRRAGGRPAPARCAGRRHEPLPRYQAAGSRRTASKVDPAAGYTPEIKDITKYLYNVEVTPIAANTLPSTLGDFAASTINGTYAVPYGLIPSARRTAHREAGRERRKPVCERGRRPHRG